MEQEIATYILKLKKAAESTRQAEDRPLYERHLACAAVLLALVISDAEQTRVSSEVEAHERLWGTSWLADDVCSGPREAWQQVKAALTSYTT
ncbi:hypothetical protein BOW53_15230 [Solemya pervernicosa gill symbiont]|uniref:Uncharacterized protein n=2 Tax=Gammaproteobacteria incertae sedis TaxID=118884 RepID=A0A1T2L0B3_9GAMM|nr:hypothetical protein [Candidatus Reidiella endopervernicosa]OOZ38535.1 hypothetical protein BOW53_15230 [Solemya pervernicosa gill symbiont]QKQ27809.1 hypothetical protein HUE57_17115 [Candidatus Reidiella endopervernicosa]